MDCSHWSALTPSMISAGPDNSDPPKLSLLIAQQDSLAGIRRLRGRSQSGRAGSHYQHVTMRIALRVVVRVGQGRGVA